MGLIDTVKQNQQNIEAEAKKLADGGAAVLQLLEALKAQIAAGSPATEADLQEVIDSQARALTNLGQADTEVTQAQS